MHYSCSITCIVCRAKIELEAGTEEYVNCHLTTLNMFESKGGQFIGCWVSDSLLAKQGMAIFLRYA